jgi:hypothetical protein
MPNELRLPIKVVIPAPTDFQAPRGGGGARKTFGNVTPQVRTGLSTQVINVNQHFFGTLERTTVLPAVARVVLKNKALAKSHRPSALFNPDTCPIIGGRDFGELLVSVRAEGLRRLLRKLQEDDTATGKADISTIDRIEPYRSTDALRMSTEAQAAMARQEFVDIKYRLFRHMDRDLDRVVLGAFHELIAQMGLQSQALRYGDGQQVFKLTQVPPQGVVALASFVGTQALGDFPVYHAVRTEAIPLRQAQIGDFPSPLSQETYPVVGIIDSGVNPNDPLLAPWVAARESYVPQQFQDHHHGTFVAGLIVNGRKLNHDDPRFPEARAKFVDVVAIPGAGQAVREDDLLTILEEVIPKHPTVKVWNLSLGTDSDACKNDAFSDFGAALDRIQEENNVRFVIAAGNFQTPPFRGWPAEDLGETDRVRPPADSVRALTIGSIAHVDRPNSRVRTEEPSPFSRRGPGGCYLPKPELVHYGGNCDQRGQYQQTGVLSIDGNRNLAENVGTSFSTPLVSSLLANIYEALGSDASHVLARAILVHSAVLRSDRLRAADLRYRGFGIPNELVGALTCDPYTATLIFEPGEVRPGKEFVKGNFPIPPCLRTDLGKVRAEFIMTLAYDPPLDLAYGAEYCRRNVDVSLGTYSPDSPKAEHKKKIPCEPRDISRLYEKHLVEHGFKWSPIKVYREDFPRGTEGDH